MDAKPRLLQHTCTKPPVYPRDAPCQWAPVIPTSTANAPAKVCLDTEHCLLVSTKWRQILTAALHGREGSEHVASPARAKGRYHRRFSSQPTPAYQVYCR